MVRSDRPPIRLVAARHAGFLGDLDVYTREEMDREPVFNEFLRPRGSAGRGDRHPGADGDTLIFDVERLVETGPVDRETVQRLDMLRLASRARGAALGPPGVRARAGCRHGARRDWSARGRDRINGDRWRPIRGSRNAMPDIVLDRHERVALDEQNADALLAHALARLALPGVDGGVRSFPIPACEERPALIVHLVPIRRAALDVFSSASAILVITPVVPAEVPTAEVLQGLFDLTPAEARVAREVAGRHTIDTIAEALGVSRETVRSQLKSVFAKTGTSRRIDLAALLTGAQISASSGVRPMHHPCG